VKKVTVCILIHWFTVELDEGIGAHVREVQRRRESLFPGAPDIKRVAVEAEKSVAIGGQNELLVAAQVQWEMI
jgi:hypothetical protein